MQIVIFCTVFATFLGLFTANCASLETDMAYIKKCNHTSPITLRTINEILINKKLSSESEVDSFMCFLHCLFMMYGWMDEEGGFNLHFVKTELDAAQVEIDSIELVLYKCTAIQSVDRCERAFEFLKCFWETMEEHEFQKKEDLKYNVHEAYKRFMSGGRDLLID